MKNNDLIKQNIDNVLKHLYINPLEKCNLACKICYTQKTRAVLSNEEISDFIKRYQKVQKVESVTFCGGEVFLLRNFTNLINELNQKDIFVQIISNGTIDQLEEIKEPNMVNLIVSIDGIEKYHDQNRGVGNFKKSVNLLKKAISLGFNIEVFSIVTQENFKQINEFENELENILKQKISITYHPRKPINYLKNHPISNVVGKVEGFNFLEDKEIRELMTKKLTFPPIDLGCYQIALMSDKKVYACCEGISPLGEIETDPKILITNLVERLKVFDKENYQTECLGCVEKDFVCGFKNQLTLKN